MTLMAALMSSAALPAYAQDAAAPAAPAVAKPAAPATTTAQHLDDEYADETVSELVVVGTRDRPQYGAVVGDIQPEVQLSPAQIQSYGVSSVSDLLNELAPQLTSNRGRGGEAPVVLLNGRRISGMGEIRDIPTEAIQRVDILPEEAALAYGYSADQRVVNFVLRRRFRAITAEVGGGGPTNGGQTNASAELNRIQILGDNRINFVLKAQASNAITADERDVDQLSSTQPFDLTGNIASATRGAQIDPALSAIAGRAVTVAGLPVSAVNGQPLTLAGLAATAGVANVSDVNRFRTLVPETKTITGNAVLARTLPWDMRGTLTANFSASNSQSLRGLPGASLTVLDANPFSPFATDTTLNRYVTAFGPLQQQTDSWSGQIGGSLNKDLDKWRLSLTGAYDHADSFTVSDVGVDITALQSAVNAGTVSPYAPWSTGLISERGGNKARSISDGINLQGVASGPAFDVPAGPVRTSIKIGEAASWLSSDTLRLGVERDADLSRNTLSAQGSVDVPLTSKKNDVLPFLGDLSLNANAAVNELSDFGTLTTIGFGANWKPITGLSFIASHTRDQGAPTMSQLGGPQVVTEASRVFDYVTGRTVEVLRVDGGNAALIGDERNVTKLGFTWKPITGQDLTISANYAYSKIDNPIATFPAVTAEIQAAFPDRFVRNTAGDLIQVDYRPVNFAQTKQESLRWGINYSRPWGPQPPPRQPGQFGPGGPGGQGQGAQGQQGQRQQGAQGQAGQAQGQAAQGQRAQGQQAAGANVAEAFGTPGERPPGGSPDTTAPSAPVGSEQASGGQNQSGAGFGNAPNFGPGGPGGGFRGGPGGGPGGLAGRLQFAVYHTVHFEDEIVVRDGGPVFDLLNGSAAGNGGGQPRHEVQAQAGVSRNGLGARLSASWQSATTVDAPASSPVGNLHFGDIATVDLRLFANLGANRELVAKQPFFRGSRMTLSITNLFDAQQSVRDVTGATPAGYRPDELNPTGRVVSLSFRKLFF